MRIRNALFVSLLGFFLSVLAPGSAKAEQSQFTSDSISLDEFIQYFPMDVGTKWVYKIEVGDIEPLHYREELWQMGEKTFFYRVSGAFVDLRKTNQRTFMLEIRVKRRISEGNGVDLEIKQDELGIFKFHKQVLWIAPEFELYKLGSEIRKSGDFMVHQMINYSPWGPAAPTGPYGVPAFEKGNSSRTIFFAGKPGSRVSIVDNPTEMLLFTGVETLFQQRKEGQLIHFVREVKSSEENNDEKRTDFKDFIEDMWFAKGKGLVRLEQKVDGKRSMVWTLVQFSKGTK